MGGLLDGIKVIDLSLQLPGPFCTLMMADYGADVIKVDEPFPRKRIVFGEERGPGLSPGEIYLNRNKRSLTLNLKEMLGRDVLYRLVKNADVFLEGFRPGVAGRLGVDYGTLRNINPRIVYCSISGFGQTGPKRNMAGHDINYISLSGILGISGYPGGGPVIPPVQVADLGGGALMALSGILMALLSRERSKEGSYLDVSMMDGAFSWLSVHAAVGIYSGQRPVRGKTELTGLLPGYNVYRCRDGKYVSLGALEEWFFDRFCEVIGRDDLKGKSVEPDPSGEIIDELAREFEKKERHVWLQIFESEDVCLSPVYDLHEVFDDPQIVEREMLIDTEHPEFGKVRQAGFPIKFSHGNGSIRRRAPYLGEHNEEILSSLGYGADEITELGERGIIRA